MSPNLRASAVAAVTAALLGSGGCQAQDPCPPPGGACGGDPAGEWEVVGKCQEAAYVPPLPLTYNDQPSNLARQPPPEATSSDWCSYLVYDPVRGVTNFEFPHDALSLTGGSVTYDPSGVFATILSTQGGGSIDLSGSCLSRFAAGPACDELTLALRAFAATEPSYQNIACTDDGGGGCRCRYDISFLPSGGPLSGRWGTNGGLLTHFAGSRQLPSQVDYCLGDDGLLTMWGHDRTDIWDQPGLRNLVLRRKQ